MYCQRCFGLLYIKTMGAYFHAIHLVFLPHVLGTFLCLDTHLRHRAQLQSMWPDNGWLLCHLTRLLIDCLVHLIGADMSLCKSVYFDHIWRNLRLSFRIYRTLLLTNNRWIFHWCHLINQIYICNYIYFTNTSRVVTIYGSRYTYGTCTSRFIVISTGISKHLSWKQRLISFNIWYMNRTIFSFLHSILLVIYCVV